MSEPQKKSEQNVVVAALYRFTKLADPEALREKLFQLCTELDLMGTLLVADEGLNGTVAGHETAIDHLLTYLCSIPGFEDIDCKRSWHRDQPFYRMKVRLKSEIVTMGQPGIDPTRSVGTYVAPEDWNELIETSGVTLIDTRNRYEVNLGRFKGAVDPATDSFREFPEFVKNHLDPERNPKVAMYCTGGIRCEKSTAYLLQQGFKEVFHLQGGILNYLEKVPQQDSLWDGDCFVFDNRVTVDHDLQAGDIEVCPNCRMPVTPEDKKLAEYEEHISCKNCFDRVDEARRASLLERRKQIDLARMRGEKHIGQQMKGDS